MTDELLDARLRAAGDRWRAAHPEPAHVDFRHLAADPPAVVPVVPAVRGAATAPRRARLWLAAAAAVAATVAAALLVVQLGGSKSKTPSGSASALLGVDWRLVQVVDQAGHATQAGPAQLTVSADGRLSGTDGCNHIGATVQVSATELDVRGLLTTDMGCLNPNPAIGIAERAIHAMLSGTVRWSVSGDELTLTKDGAGSLIYRAVKHTTTTDPEALVGPIWALSGIEHDTGNSGSATGSSGMASTTVTLDSTGHLTISHRCYAAGADAQLGRGTLDIGKVTLTGAIPCPTAADQRAEQQQDSVVDGVLTGHVVWSVHDADLTVTKGTTTLDFSVKR
jgi:heat shock protein HslJ